MMVGFNPDGSLKLPESLMKARQEKERKMKDGMCLLVKKEAVSFVAPKRCILHLKLSEAVKDSRFIENIYRYFSESSKVLTKISKLGEKEFDIEIGNDFKRCSDCTSLINRFKEFLGDNIIEEKGSCTYEGFSREQNFCYEDYFG